MPILGLIIFVANGLLSSFSLNIVIKKKCRLYIFHTISFFTIAILGIYYFDNEFIYEAVFSSVIFGIPLGFEDNILPTIIKNKNSILSYSLILSIIFLGIVIFVA